MQENVPIRRSINQVLSNRTETALKSEELTKLLEENKLLKIQIKTLEAELEKVYNDLNLEALFQDEEPSKFPLGAVVNGVLSGITLLILLFFK